MLEYCQLDPKEQTSMKFESKYKAFRSRKFIKNVAREMAAICPVGDELMFIQTSLNKYM